MRKWMPEKLNNEKYTLVEVLAWCHYPRHYWPKSKPPHVVTRPQWVKLRLYSWPISDMAFKGVTAELDQKPCKKCSKINSISLQWRHNGCPGVSIRYRFECLFNRLVRRRSKKKSKLHVTGLCEVNSPVTGEFPSQRTSNAEYVSIWWRHHVNGKFTDTVYSRSTIELRWHTTSVMTSLQIIWNDRWLKTI